MVHADLNYASVDATQILSKPDYDVKTWLYIDINTSSPQCVGEDDLTDVLEAVVPIQSAYFALGRSLRLRLDDLRSIQAAYPNESDSELALNDTLELWLKRKYNVEKFGPPTWRMLVEAINKRTGGNNHDLAKEIASDHPAAGIMDNSTLYFALCICHTFMYVYLQYAHIPASIGSILHKLLNPIIQFQYMQVLILMVMLLYNLHHPRR